MIKTIAASLLLAGLLLTACSRTTPQPEISAVNIELLGFDGCPNTPAFRERVEQAATEVGGYRVIYIDQESLPADDLRRGYATPTALVDGEDLFGLPRPQTPAMGCRMYPGGLPSVEEIAVQLRESGPSDG